MLDQDTDRHISPAQLDYWRRRLPNSPGMRELSQDRPWEKLTRQKREINRQLRDYAEDRRRATLDRGGVDRRRDTLLTALLRRHKAGTALPPRIIRSDEVLRLVAEASGISVRDIRSPMRNRHIVVARQAAAHLIRKHCNLAGGASLSLPQIGRTLGNRDHSTVLHALRRVDEGFDRFKPIIEYVEERL